MAKLLSWFSGWERQNVRAGQSRGSAWELPSLVMYLGLCSAPLWLSGAAGSPRYQSCQELMA